MMTSPPVGGERLMGHGGKPVFVIPQSLPLTEIKGEVRRASGDSLSRRYTAEASPTFLMKVPDRTLKLSLFYATLV